MLRSTSSANRSSHGRGCPSSDDPRTSVATGIGRFTLLPVLAPGIESTGRLAEDGVAVIVDDGGYGMLRYDQDRAGEDHRGVDLLRPDFVALATSFGIPAVALDGVEGLQAALATALGSREPRLVVLRLALTPPRTTSPRWRD